MKNALKIITLTALISMNTSAYALDPNLLSRIGDLGQIFNDLKAQAETFTKFKDQLYGEIDINNLNQKLTGLLNGMGISNISEQFGVNLNEMFANPQIWQDKISEIKQQILDNFSKESSQLSFNSFDKNNDLWRISTLNPDTLKMKLDGLVLEQGETIKKTESIQNILDSVKYVEENKATIEETAKTSEKVNENAANFAAKSQEIQSTREGIQMLVQTQAASLANSAYNAQAIATSLGQLARQQQVTNTQLAELVNDRIEERTSKIKGAMQEMRIAEAKAVSAGKQVSDTIKLAADGFSAPFKEDLSADPSDMFR